MKKSRLISLLCLPAMLLESCGSNFQNIGLFIYSSADTFINTVALNIDESFKDAPYNIIKYDAKNNQNKQNRQIIEAIEEENCSKLLINMVDRLSSVTIIEKAKQKDIPIIFFNREPVYEDIKNSTNVYYVGTDPQSDGRNQGIMAEKLLYNPNNPSTINPEIDSNNNNVLDCVFIKGEQGHQDAERRTSTCLNYLSERGYQINVLETVNANWDRKQGKDAMEHLYANFGNNIEFVFSNNDDMSLGAIDYLLEQKIFKNGIHYDEQPFPIVSVDGTEAGLKAIENGTLYGTSINNGLVQSKAILKLTELIDGKISIQEFPFKFVKEKYVYISGMIKVGKSSK